MSQHPSIRYRDTRDFPTLQEHRSYKISNIRLLPIARIAGYIRLKTSYQHAIDSYRYYDIKYYTK